MRGSGRVGCLAAFVAVLLLHSGVPAGAGTLESVTATGSVTYTWHGDPSRGCAAVGVCELSGEVVLHPQGQSAVNSSGGLTDIPIGGSATTRVLRGTGPAPAGECVDVPESPIGLDLRIFRRGGLMAAIQPPPSSGRCAGPLAADLTGVSLPVRRSRGRQPSFDLRGTRSFAAGPFSGTLVSTLMLRPTPAELGGFSGSFFSSSHSGASPVHASTHLEYVELDYRISAPSTTIRTQFSGVGDPSCQIFDTCGTSGSLDLTVRPPAQLVVFASRLVRHRLNRGRALTDFRRGLLSVSGYAGVPATLAESFSWPDGSSCRDSKSILPLKLVLGLPGPPAVGPRMPITLGANNTPSSETLRTHCPGPTDADVIGSAGILARGSITSTQLLSGSSVISLSDPGAFAGPGYAGSRQGGVELDLTRSKLSAGTQRGA